MRRSRAASRRRPEPAVVRGPLVWPAAEIPELGAGETHVWLLDLDVPEVGLRELLSPEEQARADAFHRDVHGRRYTAAHGRIRELLGRYLGADPAALQVVEGPSGKPELRGGEVRFNLAHSEGVGLCAVARVEVGVDVEVVAGRRLPDWLAIAERFFHADEVSALASWVDFLRVWTLKEAVLKATGLGLATDPSTFSVAHVLRERSGPVALGGREWRCVELDLGRDAVAALASAAPAPRSRTSRSAPRGPRSSGTG